jgi:hypothetical protein
LAPLQHGLQTAHAVSEMSLLEDPAMHQAYLAWASQHKTIIICNGGNSLQLDELYHQLKDLQARLLYQHDLPVVRFYEDEQSLNGALTAVCILLPEELYEVTFVKSVSGPDLYVRESDAAGVVAYKYYIDTQDIEFELIKLVKQHRLA